jgi:hypothetical protein
MSQERCFYDRAKVTCRLSRIHNTSLISAYFGLDSRECKCLGLDLDFNGQALHCFLFQIKFQNRLNHKLINKVIKQLNRLTKTGRICYRRTS